MKFEVLLSAMYLEDYRYINTLNITTDCVVVNQCDTNDVQIIADEGRNITFICTTERGLSRSRNMAIANATADICIFCDNDVEYLPNYEKLIIEQFEKYSEFDIIVFFVKRHNRLRPNYKRVKRMGYLSTMKVSSYEIAFKRKSIVDRDIKFNPQFGAGAKYSMGEENIFLYECLKKGLKVLYVPIQIANLRYEESTWFSGYTRKYFIDRGAIFYEMTNKFSILMIMQFAVRKYKLYKNEMTMRNAIRFMIQGKKQYQLELKYKQNDK